MPFSHTVAGQTYHFVDLKMLLARASPYRSGDALAGLAAASGEERMAARIALAELPLKAFLAEDLIPYESDEVTRLIADTHDAAAFAPLSHLTVGDFREWLLDSTHTSEELAAAAPGITPEMAAAASKLMRNQDLVLVARRCRVVTRFRNTLGLPNRMAVRLQPNHPSDDIEGIFASTLDGLMLGAGDAVIGINPASDSIPEAMRLLHALDRFRIRFDIPVQTCVLTHVTNTVRAIEAGAPVDLVFQSIAVAPSGRTSCISRPGREVRCLPARISMWTSKPARPVPMLLHATFLHF
jgi:ethanolamine ammonia-lyase large subunit